MHELGLCAPLVDAAVRRAGERIVDHLEVRVGTRHRVVPEAFQQAFALAAEGTVAAGAAVTVVPVPMEVTCRACGACSEVDDPLPACPACGGVEVSVAGGDELVLTRLTYRGS